MLRFVADENFNNVIVRGLRRRLPTIDIVRVQDVGLLHADDPAILQWVALAGRVVLTHDVTTMTAYTLERVVNGLPTSGIVQVGRKLSIGAVIDDLCLLAEAGCAADFDDPICYLPL